VSYREHVSNLFEASAVAAKLPGVWRVAATNFPMWLDGSRHNPTFSYELVEGEELTFADTVSYTTRDGETKTIIGVDQLRGDEFVWRGQGWLKIFTSRWHIVGANADSSILVIRFSRSRLTPAGIDIIVREDTPTDNLRSTVAHATEQFGLSAEDFASLTWLA